MKRRAFHERLWEADRNLPHCNCYYYCYYSYDYYHYQRRTDAATGADTATPANDGLIGGRRHRDSCKPRPQQLHTAVAQFAWRGRPSAARAVKRARATLRGQAGATWQSTQLVDVAAATD